MTDTELQVLQVKVRLQQLDTRLQVRDISEQFQVSRQTAALCVAAAGGTAQCRALMRAYWDRLLKERGSFYERDLVAAVADAMGVVTP